MNKLRSKQLLEKMPRYENVTRKIVILLVIFILALFILPWRQTAIGHGYVIAYSPNDRQQNISAPITGRLGTWFVQACRAAPDALRPS